MALHLTRKSQKPSGSLHVSVQLPFLRLLQSTLPALSSLSPAVLTLDLSLDQHISSVRRSSYFHLRALHHIRSVLTDDLAQSVAVTLVSSHLDYANSVLLALLLLILIKFSEFMILLPK